MVFEKVREILADQLDLDEGSITMDSFIVEDLGADSLDVVDIEVPDEEIENMKTVGDIVHFLESME